MLLRTPSMPSARVSPLWTWCTPSNARAAKCIRHSNGSFSHQTLQNRMTNILLMRPKSSDILFENANKIDVNFGLIWKRNLGANQQGLIWHVFRI